jgi:hypothetical protein
MSLFFPASHRACADLLLSSLLFCSIGLAYAGAHRQDLLDTLSPLVAEDANSMEVVSMTALALGHIYVGSANGEIAETILTAMSERSDEQLDEKWSRFMALGLALLYVGASNPLFRVWLAFGTDQADLLFPRRIFPFRPTRCFGRYRRDP